MNNYTHRERVLAVLNHEKPDRLPVDLMGNACMLLDNTYLALRDHLNLSPIPPIRSGTTANYYDERILEHLDIDFRRIFLKKNSKNKLKINSDGSFNDVWDIKYKNINNLVNVINNPLRNAKSIKDIEKYQWPIAKDIFTTEVLLDDVKRLFYNTDYIISFLIR